MSYFSPKSTWLCLVEDAFEEESTGHTLPPEDSTFTFEGFIPCLPESQSTESEDLESEQPEQIAPSLDHLKAMKELRHRLVFYHQDWSFGSELLTDNLKLAQLQCDPEEALAHFCHARHIAKTLVLEKNDAALLPTWLSINVAIAELHHRLGNHESAFLYAKEGLDTIKKNRFEGSWDPYITKIVIRFIHLLSRN